MSVEREVQAVQRLLARERLSVDQCEDGRTTFLSHLGAQARLVPGPWIAHRDLVYALAMANLTPAQRSSLAHAVRTEHGREFGVGRSRLRTAPSGLPLGGSSLLITPRGEGPTCLYTWALGPKAQPERCDWLLLRAQPEWGLPSPPRGLTARGLETLTQIGADVVVGVAGATAARQVADLVRGVVAVGGHPRFLPHLADEPDPAASKAKLLVWPHDALNTPSLARRRVDTLVLVDAPEEVRRTAERWADARERVEVTEAVCPGRLGREAMLDFWSACGRPKVLLRGDPAWLHPAETRLREAGAVVVARSDGTQLRLL